MTIEAAQMLHLGKNDSIHITTPLGVIRIDRDGKDSRKLLFHYPMIEGFYAYKGDKPEIKTVPLVTKDENGRLVPQFSVLAPVLDEDGNMVAVRPPEVFRLQEVPRVPEESAKGDSDELQPVPEVRTDAGPDNLGEDS
jgi:hypothetical protein